LGLGTLGFFCPQLAAVPWSYNWPKEKTTTYYYKPKFENQMMPNVAKQPNFGLAWAHLGTNQTHFVYRKKKNQTHF
jgi:hypothetical protein